MRVIDPHCHMIARVTDDYVRMAECGIAAVVEPAFWLGEPRRHPGTFYDYFDHLLGYETQRAAQFGIEHYATVSVNPRESNAAALRDEVLQEMPRWLSHPRCLGIGEVGFDAITDDEEDSLRRQLEMVGENEDLVVIVHLPHRDKLRGTLRTIEVIRRAGIDPARVVLDHNTEETIEASLESGCWCGHTIYPTKLSPERAVAILERYGTDRMLINSSCDWGPSDPLSVPRAMVELRRRGIPEAEIEKVVWGNPVAFYSRTGRFLGPGGGCA